MKVDDAVKVPQSGAVEVMMEMMTLEEDDLVHLLLWRRDEAMGNICFQVAVGFHKILCLS